MYTPWVIINNIRYDHMSPEVRMEPVNYWRVGDYNVHFSLKGEKLERKEKKGTKKENFLEGVKKNLNEITQKLEKIREMK